MVTTLTDHNNSLSSRTEIPASSICRILSKARCFVFQISLFSAGHGGPWQVFFLSSFPGQDLPPFCGCCFTVLYRIDFPTPQETLHGVQSDHSEVMQSTFWFGGTLPSSKVSSSASSCSAKGVWGYFSERGRSEFRSTLPRILPHASLHSD